MMNPFSCAFILVLFLSPKTQVKWIEYYFNSLLAPSTRTGTLFLAASSVRESL